MKNLQCLLIVALFLLTASIQINAQSSAFEETPIVLTTPTGEIHGTLTAPKSGKKTSVALLIAGSGPTDRNGNNKFAKNESFKILAKDLAEKNIATVRYDKRGVGQSESAMESESDLRFEDYVNDAKAWVDLLKKDERFKKIIVIGHSEGSLIGMLASANANGFVSLAGPGEVADVVLKAQLATIPENMKKSTFASIDTLKSGITLKTVDPRLYSIFRPSVQPYLISWFKYDPSIEIAKLKIPVLILQGTYDLQVPVDHAKKLSKSNSKAKLVILEGMNHVLRKTTDDTQANYATYSNPALPLHEELVKNLVSFIKKI